MSAVRLGSVPRHRRGSNSEVNGLDSQNQYTSPHTPYHSRSLRTRPVLNFGGGSLGKVSPSPYPAGGTAACSPFEANGSGQRGEWRPSEALPHMGRPISCGLGSRRRSSSGLSIFDLELDAEDLPVYPRSLTPLPDATRATVSRMQAQLSPVNKFAKSLNSAASKLREACGKSQQWGYTINTTELGESLAELGYQVDLKTTSGKRGLHLPHCYLWVTPDRSWGQGFIVDPNYKELFAVAAVSGHTHFDAVLAMLPDCFTGTRSQLAELVVVLCAILKDAFAAVGKSMPPWRSARSYLSRWNISLDGVSDLPNLLQKQSKVLQF